MARVGADAGQAGELGEGEEGGEPTEVSPGPPVGPPDEGGVEALLEIATATVEDERERGRSLDAKAASVTAFVGVVLSLNATLGRPLLNAKLGDTGDLLVRIFFIIAVVALLLGASAAVVAVFRPQGYRGLGRQQLQRFAEPQTQAMTKLAVHQAMLGALADILNTDRPVNDSKATALKFAAFFIAVGLTGVAGEALTLGHSA